MLRILFILLLMFLLSFAVFGQSFEGFYQARFISLDGGANPAAEFEIQSDGIVTGRITTGESSVEIRGQVDSVGNLEAHSGSENRVIYTLKSDMNRGGKITLTSRSETNATGRRTNSQSVMQGNYSRIEKPDAQNLPAFDRKSELLIEEPNPLFEKEFTSSDAKVIVEKNSSIDVYNFQMMGGAENTERGFYFSISRIQDSPQKIWKIENIRALNYVEKTENYTKINRFRTSYEMWLKNKNVASGEIELISEDNRQMIFKINNLKIKNEANNDMVIINGTVSAEISK